MLNPPFYRQCLTTVARTDTKSKLNRFLSSSKVPPNSSSRNNVATCNDAKSQSKAPNTCLLTFPLGKDEAIDVGDTARRLGVRLTSCEKHLLQKIMDKDGNGIITSNDFALASRRALEDRTMRELCL